MEPSDELARSSNLVAVIEEFLHQLEEPSEDGTIVSNESLEQLIVAEDNVDTPHYSTMTLQADRNHVYNKNIPDVPDSFESTHLTGIYSSEESNSRNSRISMDITGAGGVSNGQRRDTTFTENITSGYPYESMIKPQDGSDPDIPCRDNTSKNNKTGYSISTNLKISSTIVFTAAPATSGNASIENVQALPIPKSSFPVSLSQTNHMPTTKPEVWNNCQPCSVIQHTRNSKLIRIESASKCKIVTNEKINTYINPQNSKSIRTRSLVAAKVSNRDPRLKTRPGEINTNLNNFTSEAHYSTSNCGESSRKFSDMNIPDLQDVFSHSPGSQQNNSSAMNSQLKVYNKQKPKSATSLFTCSSTLTNSSYSSENQLHSDESSEKLQDIINDSQDKPPDLIPIIIADTLNTTTQTSTTSDNIENDNTVLNLYKSYTNSDKEYSLANTSGENNVWSQRHQVFFKRTSVFPQRIPLPVVYTRPRIFESDSTTDSWNLREPPPAHTRTSDENINSAQENSHEELPESPPPAHAGTHYSTVTQKYIHAEHTCENSEYQQIWQQSEEINAIVDRTHVKTIAEDGEAEEVDEVYQVATKREANFEPMIIDKKRINDIQQELVQVTVSGKKYKQRDQNTVSASNSCNSSQTNVQSALGLRKMLHNFQNVTSETTAVNEQINNNSSVMTHSQHEMTVELHDNSSNTIASRPNQFQTNVTTQLLPNYQMNGSAPRHNLNSENRFNNLECGRIGSAQELQILQNSKQTSTLHSQIEYNHFTQSQIPQISHQSVSDALLHNPENNHSIPAYDTHHPNFNPLYNLPASNHISTQGNQNPNAISTASYNGSNPYVNNTLVPFTPNPTEYIQNSHRIDRVSNRAQLQYHLNNSYGISFPSTYQSNNHNLESTPHRNHFDQYIQQTLPTATEYGWRHDPSPITMRAETHHTRLAQPPNETLSYRNRLFDHIPSPPRTSQPADILSDRRFWQQFLPVPNGLDPSRNLNRNSALHVNNNYFNRQVYTPRYHYP